VKPASVEVPRPALVVAGLGHRREERWSEPQGATEGLRNTRRPSVGPRGWVRRPRAELVASVQSSAPAAKSGPGTGSIRERVAVAARIGARKAWHKSQGRS